MKRSVSMILALVITISILCMFAIAPASVRATTAINIGDYVTMGSYYGKPILWRCVDIDANGPLMLSDRILSVKSFDVGGSHTYADGTPQSDNNNYRSISGSNLWETSNMRSWLNSTATAGNVAWLDGSPPTAAWVGSEAYDGEKGFLAGGNFTIDELASMKSVTQKSILTNVDVAKLRTGGTTALDYNNNIALVVQDYGDANYHDVTDRMFLLDVKQLNNMYLNRSILGEDYWKGKPTQEAVDNAREQQGFTADGYWHYWLRTPHTDVSTGVRVVLSTGAVVSVNSMYTAVYYGIGVRPAFYMDQKLSPSPSASPSESPSASPSESPSTPPSESPSTPPSESPKPTAPPTSPPILVPVTLDFSYAYINGYSSGKVGFNDPLTREQICAALYRIYKQSGKTTGYLKPTISDFTDLATNKWSYAAIEYMVSVGAISKGATVNPTGPVTRGEIAKIIAISDNMTDNQVVLTFSDLPNTHQYFKYMNMVVNYGLIRGYGNNLIKPNGLITRAEFVTMINRFIGRDSRYNVSGLPSLYSDLLPSHWAFAEIQRASFGFTAIVDDSGYFQVDVNQIISKAELDN